MPEAAYYHVLNIFADGSRPMLAKLRALHGSWSACWSRLSEWLGPRALPDPAEETERLASMRIGLLLPEEPAYPFLLRQIPHPPFGLYYRGALADAAAADTAAAVVGTRRATSEGRALARSFAGALARAGCTVVSGLAFGIDAAAHEGALNAGGRTIAVLANGLDEVHPRSHTSLARRILAHGGALVSEYPPKNPARAYRFLERNRIVSGLSKAVVIIEAPERSGVLTTSRFALEQNRDIFVVPGAVSHPNYRGSNNLLRRGATPVTQPSELLQDMGIVEPAALAEVRADTPEEARVIAALKDARRALNIDEIARAATLTSAVAAQTATMLVLRNALREADGRYELCSSSS